MSSSGVAIISIVLICFIAGPVSGIKVLAEGSVARERVDAIFLRCDVINLGPEDEIYRVTWRHNDTVRGVWSDVFTVDLTNDAPAYFFFSQWAGRGQYNPISLATVMLSSSYVTRYSSGTYRCDVETANTRGYANTYVDVYYGPGTSIVITPGGRVQKTEGEELVLSCHAQCNPDCSYRWYKSGRRLSSLSSLRLTSVSRHEGGLYACQARNEAGRSIKPVEIRVLYRPAILDLTLVTSQSNVSNTPRSNKEDVVLQCRIQAWPEPEVRWFRGSNLLQNTTNADGIEITTWSVGLEHQTSRLRINNVTCLNNGLYSCKAHNSIGESTTQYKHITQDCPPFQVLDSDICPIVSGASRKRGTTTFEIEKKFGDEVPMQFCYTGHPIPKVQITRKTDKSKTVNDISVPSIVCHDETNVCVLEYSFIITSHLQYGLYEIKITNRIGSFVKTYRVVSKQAPLTPQNIALTTVTSTSACISWVAGYNGGSDQTFNLIYSRLDSYSDRTDDGNAEPNHASIRMDQNSGIVANGRDNIFYGRTNPNFEMFQDEYSHKTSDEIGRSKPANGEITTGRDVFDTDWSTPISTCLPNLFPASTYSLKIEAINVHGKSQASDAVYFQTLHELTTTTPTPPPSSSPPPPSTTTIATLPTTTTRKTMFLTLKNIDIKLIAVTPHTASPKITSTSKSKIPNIFSNLRRRLGDFQQFPIHDETLATEDTTLQVRPSISPLIPPTPNNEPKYPTRSTEDDYLWNSEEDHYHNHDDNNNNNHHLDNGDNYIETQSFSVDDSDERYNDDDSDDTDDDDDESRLFQALFPYFKAVLFQQDIKEPSLLPTRQQSYTQAPKGPFEVGRYFKKYNHIEKQKHVIPDISSDDIFLLNNTFISTTDNSNHENSDTKPPNKSYTTQTTPRSNGHHFAVTSSVSIASTAVLLLVIAIIITLKLVLRRRRGLLRKRSQNSTTSLSPGSEDGCITPTPFTTSQTVMPSTSRVKTISHVKTSGRNCQNINNSGSGYPLISQTTRQPSNHSHTNNHPPTKCPSINTRPRLSTPKVYRRDRLECKYANSKTASPSASMVKDHATSLESVIRRPNPNHHINNTLTIPGISVNDKRISSPSYLELCMGSSSSSESSQQLPLRPKQIPPSDNSGSGKIDVLATRRSSYSSVIMIDDVVENSNLDTSSTKWNSYLDLCEALSVKSGSRSPSNIYDPLDIADKISIRSVTSYVSPNTPELARKVLEGKYSNHSMGLPHSGNDLYQQYSPQEIRKNIVNKRKLCPEPSESDTSSHYEKCISLTYDMDDIDRIKAVTGKETKVFNVEETFSVLESNLNSCTMSKTVEYMNEENGNSSSNSQTSHFLNNKLECKKTQQIMCDQDVENNNSVYNEIDTPTNDNDHSDLKTINTKQLDQQGSGTNLKVLRKKNKKDSCHFQSERSSKLSTCPTVGKCTKKETNKGENKLNVTNSCQRFEGSNQAEYSIPKSKLAKDKRKANNSKTKTQRKSNKKIVEISRKDSSSHYYSDIDTKY